VVTLHAAIDRQALVDIAALMEPEQEKVIYLRIARRAAIDGLIDFAAFAATHAEDVEADPRAELYSSLSSVTSGTVEDVSAKLSRIDRGRLSESDRQLLDAASAITREMTVAPTGLKPAAHKPDTRPEVRSVGPESHVASPVTAAPAQAPAVGHEPPLSSEAKAVPVAASTQDNAGRSADATADQADTMVAQTRAKLADIDKLLGDMPE
jgi:chemotaxis protein MotC